MLPAGCMSTHIYIVPPVIAHTCTETGGEGERRVEREGLGYRELLRTWLRNLRTRPAAATGALFS